MITLLEMFQRFQSDHNFSYNNVEHCVKISVIYHLLKGSYSLLSTLNWMCVEDSFSQIWSHNNYIDLYKFIICLLY